MNFGPITAIIIAITAGGWTAKQLIVNADDCGLHSAVNHAIFNTHREGIVTSTTILAGGSAYTEAVEGVKKLPDLGVGIHLCLVDQFPVSSPDKIPSLLDYNGRLHASHQVFSGNYFSGKIALDEVHIELKAQIERALDSGLKLTHFDSHQHLHLLPKIAVEIGELARHFGLNKTRIPIDNKHLGRRTGSLKRKIEGLIVNNFASRARTIYSGFGISSTDRFYGFACGGRLDLEVWKTLLPLIADGVTEIMVHPGDNDDILSSETNWGYAWQSELEALMHSDTQSLIKQHNIQLVNFGNLR
jgi:hopanoid biosynthesis associated protein HpnK